MNAEDKPRLGAVIKRLRKERGLTQSALCGDEISRNLLSQIETGTVNPSLQTLTFLATRLNVPLSTLFLSDEEAAVLRKERLLLRIREAWSNHDHSRCLALCEQLPGEEGEICEYRARAAYRLGYEAYRTADFKSASTYFSIVISAGSICQTYADAAKELLIRMEQLTTPNAPLPLFWGDPLTGAADCALLTLARACIEAGKAETISQTFLTQTFVDSSTKFLVLSMLFAACGKDHECRNAQISVREKQLDPVAALYFYRFVEECCARMNDYESAYRVSVKRAQLLEKIQKSQNHHAEDSK